MKEQRRTNKSFLSRFINRNLVAVEKPSVHAGFRGLVFLHKSLCLPLRIRVAKKCLLKVILIRGGVACSGVPTPLLHQTLFSFIEIGTLTLLFRTRNYYGDVGEFVKCVL